MMAEAAAISAAISANGHGSVPPSLSFVEDASLRSTVPAVTSVEEHRHRSRSHHSKNSGNHRRRKNARQNSVGEVEHQLPAGGPSIQRRSEMHTKTSEASHQSNVRSSKLYSDGNSGRPGTFAGGSESATEAESKTARRVVGRPRQEPRALPLEPERHTVQPGSSILHVSRSPGRSQSPVVPAQHPASDDDATTNGKRFDGDSDIVEHFDNSETHSRHDIFQNRLDPENDEHNRELSAMVDTIETAKTVESLHEEISNPIDRHEGGRIAAPAATPSSWFRNDIENEFFGHQRRYSDQLPSQYVTNRHTAFGHPTRPGSRESGSGLSSSGGGFRGSGGSQMRRTSNRQGSGRDLSLPVKPTGRERFSIELEEGQINIPAPLENPILKPEFERDLSFDINDLMQTTLLPTPESQNCRKRFLAKLQYILTKEWPDKDIHVHPFGSTVNGLGSSTSDVDVCLTTPWDDRFEGVSNMNVLANCLRKHGMVNIYTVTKAKVPICKFYDPEYHVSCDVNVNNTQAIRNTVLVKTYVDLDPRVRPIIMVIKHWAKQRVLNDAAKGGTLSSYCWVMMVINFLQTRSPPILPCLHEMYFAKLAAARPSSSATMEEPHSAPHLNQVIIDGVDCSFEDDFTTIRSTWSSVTTPNHESLGGLLFEFFLLYAQRFDYDRDVVSVRHGRLLTKAEKNWDVDIEKMCRYLCVEEPMTPQRNLANSADAVSVAGLRKEFDRALRCIVLRGALQAVCEPYAAPYSSTSQRRREGSVGAPEGSPQLGPYTVHQRQLDRSNSIGSSTFNNKRSGGNSGGSHRGGVLGEDQNQRYWGQKPQRSASGGSNVFQVHGPHGWRPMTSSPPSPVLFNGESAFRASVGDSPLPGRGDLDEPASGLNNSALNGLGPWGESNPNSSTPSSPRLPSKFHQDAPVQQTPSLFYAPTPDGGYQLYISQPTLALAATQQTQMLFDPITSGWMAASPIISQFPHSQHIIVLNGNSQHSKQLSGDSSYSEPLRTGLEEQDPPADQYLFPVSLVHPGLYNSQTPPPAHRSTVHASKVPRDDAFSDNDGDDTSQSRSGDDDGHHSLQGSNDAPYTPTGLPPASDSRPMHSDPDLPGSSSFSGVTVESASPNASTTPLAPLRSRQQLVSNGWTTVSKPDTSWDAMVLTAMQQHQSLPNHYFAYKQSQYDSHSAATPWNGNDGVKSFGNTHSLSQRTSRSSNRGRPVNLTVSTASNRNQTLSSEGNFRYGSGHYSGDIPSPVPASPTGFASSLHNSMSEPRNSSPMRRSSNGNGYNSQVPPLSPGFSRQQYSSRQRRPSYQSQHSNSYNYRRQSSPSPSISSNTQRSRGISPTHLVSNRSVALSSPSGLGWHTPLTSEDDIRDSETVSGEGYFNYNPLEFDNDNSMIGRNNRGWGNNYRPDGSRTPQSPTVVSHQDVNWINEGSQLLSSAQGGTLSNGMRRNSRSRIVSVDSGLHRFPDSLVGLSGSNVGYDTWRPIPSSKSSYSGSQAALDSERDRNGFYSIGGDFDEWRDVTPDPSLIVIDRGEVVGNVSPELLGVVDNAHTAIVPTSLTLVPATGDVLERNQDEEIRDVPGSISSSPELPSPISRSSMSSMQTYAAAIGAATPTQSSASGTLATSSSSSTAGTTSHASSSDNAPPLTNIVPQIESSRSMSTPLPSPPRSSTVQESVPGKLAWAAVVKKSVTSASKK